MTGSDYYSRHCNICSELKKHIRDIDICTSSNSGVIWLLLPLKNSKNVNFTLKRLNVFLDELSKSASGGYSLKRTLFTSTRKNVEGINAELLLSQMRGML